MKKIFVLILSIIFVFAFSSCNSNNTNNEINMEYYIEAVNNIPEKLKKFSVLNKYEDDLNTDGVKDSVVLYTDAEIIDGETYFNDGNTFSLVFIDGMKKECYILFDEYVQLGNVYFQVADYFDNGKTILTITLYESSGAVLRMTNFSLDKEKGFLKEILYDSSTKSENGINLKYSSIPSL